MSELMRGNMRCSKTEWPVGHGPEIAEPHVVAALIRSGGASGRKNFTPNFRRYATRTCGYIGYRIDVAKWPRPSLLDSVDIRTARSGTRSSKLHVSGDV